jgi:hypothetical protein
VLAKTKSSVAAVLFAVCAITAVSHAADNQQDRVKTAVDRAVQPVMAKYNIPGMAVGVTVGGKARLDNGEEYGPGFYRADGTALVSCSRHEEQLRRRSGSQNGDYAQGYTEEVLRSE